MTTNILNSLINNMIFFLNFPSKLYFKLNNFHKKHKKILEKNFLNFFVYKNKYLYKKH